MSWIKRWRPMTRYERWCIYVSLIKLLLALKLVKYHDRAATMEEFEQFASKYAK